MSIFSKDLVAKDPETIILTRRFHPVGQGAFYTEVFSCGGKTCFCAVYDCGTETGQSRFDKSGSKYLTEQIDEFVEKNDIRQIDLLCISHFHKDHISGLDHLINYGKRPLKVMKTLIPMLPEEVVTLTRMHNLLLDGDENSRMDGIVKELYYGDSKGRGRFGEVIAVSPEEDEMHTGNNDNSRLLPSFGRRVDNGKDLDFNAGENGRDKSLFWIYKPFNPILPSESIAKQVLDNIKGSLPETFRADGTLDAEKIMNDKDFRGKLKQAYNKAFEKKGDNLYSLVVESKPALEESVLSWKEDKRIVSDAMSRFPYEMAKCLYFGDLDCSGKTWDRLTKTFNDYKKIGVVQIPHHGAKKNFEPKMLDDNPRLFVASAGSTNGYHHPNYWVLNEISLRGGEWRVVSEDMGSEVRLEYEIG